MFDQEVADSFDDMLVRSIPQYHVMRDAVTEIACSYLQPGRDVLDLGCSRGEAIARIYESLTSEHRRLQTRLVGIEIAQSMLAAARTRFVGEELVEIVEHDLRERLPVFNGHNFGVVLSVLTLQFVPIEYRQRRLADAYRALVPGGALVVVEKVLGATDELDRLMVEHYYAQKRDMGYSDDQIERKRLALEGVLVPVTARWNEELLRDAGFSDVDCFWRWMNFAGWVAVKAHR